MDSHSIRRLGLAAAAVALAMGLVMAPPPPSARAASVADQTVAHSLDPGGSDIIGVGTNGNLYLWRGDNSGGIEAATTIGTGWSKFDEVQLIGDFNGDGNSDVLARYRPDGSLWLYPGQGDGGLKNGIKIGAGWSGFASIFSPGDWNGDGNVDLLAVLASTGTMWFYPGTGTGKFGSAVQIGTGFAGFDALIPTGDFNEDGDIDFFGIRSDGYGFLYSGDGTGKFAAGNPLDLGYLWEFTGYMGVGDFNGDGHGDVLARDVYGDLTLLAGNGMSREEPDFTDWVSAEIIGRGWSGISWREYRAQPNITRPPGIPVISVGDQTAAHRLGPYTADHGGDLLGIDSRGDLWRFNNDYNLNGNGAGLAPGVKIGRGWGVFDQVQFAGDLNSDGEADVVARNRSDGSLWLYFGMAAGGLSAGVKIGTGWGGMSQFFSPGDWNGDGNADLLAISKVDGTLRMYPGLGNGRLGAAQVIGTGWGGVTRMVPTGDFDSNTIIDFLGVNAQGQMILYKGTGRGGFAGQQVVGAGWGSFTAVVGMGDVDGDGNGDVLAFDSSGRLYVYSFAWGKWESQYVWSVGWKGWYLF